MSLACAVHGGQVRKGTSVPYIAHVMAVSALVLEAGGDQDCAIAALLHDAVEDSADGEATEAFIRGEFGVHVADIVHACSDAIAVPGQPKPEWHARKEAYLASLPHHDADVLLVSACDKLHNARAIVADLRAVGLDVFKRFRTQSADDQLWYYRELASAYPDRVPRPLSDELQRTVEEMDRLVDALSAPGFQATPGAP